jgi:hypothetical protein
VKESEVVVLEEVLEDLLVAVRRMSLDVFVV